MVETTPVMMVISELDGISPPAEQREAFEHVRQAKHFCLAKGKGHLAVLSGVGFQEILETQNEFIRSVIQK